jgi:hypothetical protein
VECVRISEHPTFKGACEQKNSKEALQLLRGQEPFRDRKIDLPKLTAYPGIRRDHQDESSDYCQIETDIAIVRKTRVPNRKDTWKWEDLITNETGFATNWHIENECYGRVLYHTTIKILLNIKKI